MYQSNIVAGSNVFVSHCNDPRHDEGFVRQVQNYFRLKEIADSRTHDQRIAPLDQGQQELLKTEMRCAYAKNDPCWGYKTSEKKIVSDCINEQCPRIRRCNPQYSGEAARYWRMTSQERDLYGDPGSLRSFYKVDMISEEEMLRYDACSQKEGRKYPLMRDPALKKKEAENIRDVRTRMNPETGRREVVVGHRWMITDNAGYESEELCPIWGVVDEVKERAFPPGRKSTRIKEKPEQAGRKERAASAVRDEISLTAPEKLELGQGKYVLVSANPAEMAYVSRMLLRGDIRHGFDESSDICLMLAEEYASVGEDRTVVITDAALRSEYGGRWLGTDRVFRAVLPGREYYEFKQISGESRWCCRNLYGVTHVCIKPEDTEFFEAFWEGEESIVMIARGAGYLIKVAGTKGAVIGRMKEAFTAFLMELVAKGEIEEKPARIRGIRISREEGKTCIYGMGHLIFSGY